MKAMMETSLGTITLELNEDKAPETVQHLRGLCLPHARGGVS